MKRTRLPAVLAFTLIATSALGQSSDWSDITDPKEVARIYTDKTIRAMGFVGYYRADGRGFITSPGTKPLGRRWSVRDDGLGCAKLDAGPTLCFRFQQHAANRNLIRIRDLSNGTNYTATVEDGIPDLEPFEKASQ
jgi:hypothetical protein